MCSVSVFRLPSFYILNLLSYRIEGRADVERLTNVSIIGDVPLNDSEEGTPLPSAKTTTTSWRKLSVACAPTCFSCWATRTEGHSRHLYHER